ncbi:MAG: hypothetical protein ACLR5G_16045 [Eubacteriales bacterium]
MRYLASAAGRHNTFRLSGTLFGAMRSNSREFRRREAVETDPRALGNLDDRPIFFSSSLAMSASYEHKNGILTQSGSSVSGTNSSMTLLPRCFSD